MRKCPACGKRLILTLLNPTRALTFLCGRCWATVQLDVVEFVSYTILGAALGVGLLLGLIISKGMELKDAGGGVYLVIAIAGVSGRLLPKLRVKDPPL